MKVVQACLLLFFIITKQLYKQYAKKYRSRIFGTFVVKFLACLPLLGFSNIYKMA